jgi:hypothetical protein
MVSMLKSGFGEPSTMPDGLTVFDTPSLAGKEFNQVTVDSTIDRVISFGIRLYGIP